MATKHETPAIEQLCAETRVNGAGDHLKDAVGVCAHELADPQLAIFVARLLEPKQGALLSDLLTNDLLPRKHAYPCLQ